MSRLNALKKTYAMCRRLKAQRGGALLWYLIDAVYCGYRHGASPENYFVLRFYEMKDARRRDFLTSGRSKAADAELNRCASKEQREIIARKDLFNAAMTGLVQRESIFAPDCDFGRFSAFIDRHTDFMVKPPCGTMGRGIEKIISSDIGDRRLFYERCREERLLLEERIRQHEELEKIAGGCVNTVRINAARRRDGSVCLIGACLKCGGSGAVTDNFHSGGAAYPLDIETGCVCGAGRNNTEIKDFFRHPASGADMIGLQVPHWEQVKVCVMEAMARLSTIGYAGWDIAVTPAGAELVEGNYNWPGGNIIQFDGVGKYPLIKECLADTDNR